MSTSIILRQIVQKREVVGFLMVSCGAPSQYVGKWKKNSWMRIQISIKQ